MKNESIEFLETNKSERIERAKKVYRYVSDVSRRLGDVSAEGSHAIADLFTATNEVQRQKLKDNCEKLFFLDPLSYGKKSLELLWRKAYYEPVSAAKRLRETDSKLDGYLFTHIVSGIGHFQHIITRIQSEMNIQLKELDYLTLQNDMDGAFVTKFTEEECQFGHAAIYSCLIYVGDLCRYQTELFNVFEPSIAARYYLQAAQIDLTSGMPFNQLGNLFVDRNYNLDSVCYYIHCLSCLIPFDGGLGNLTKIFDKNKQFCDVLMPLDTITQTEHIQNTVANFLSLIEIWYLGKADEHITKICSTVAQQLKLALDFTKMSLPDINDNYNDFVQAVEDENINPSYLNFNIIHNMVQICLFTIAKMTETDNLKAFACKAFTLAFLSQLLQKLLKQLVLLGLKSPALKFIPKFRSVPLVPIEKKKTEIGISEESDHLDTILTNGNETHVDVLLKTNGNTKITPNGDLKTKIFNGDLQTKIGSNPDLKANKKVVAKRRRRRRLASSGSSDLSEEDIESTDDNSDKSCSEGEMSDSTCESENDNSKSEDSFYDASDNEEELIEKVNGEHLSNEPITQNTDISNETELKTLSNGSSNMNKDSSNMSNDGSNMNDDKTETDDGGLLNIQGLQAFLLGDNILPSIKLLQDWILTEKDLILSCGESGDSLFQCVVDLLNIFIFYFNSSTQETLNKDECKIFDTAKTVAKKFKLEYKIIPLPEDIALRGTSISKFDKDAAEWKVLDKYKPSVYEENIIRILNFIDFGNQIAKIVPRIRYNKYLKVFFVKKVIPPKLTVKINSKKCREWHNSKHQEVTEGESVGLQQRMGRLWLASQVRELERTGQGPEPTLLVLDAAVLNKFLRRIKQLMRATNFVFLIPTVVLQELDNLKCERSSARDAIRWLEAELKSGSRFLKTQRPGQSRPLPLIKYPRKAPPNVHNFIEILEFCNHFTDDEKQIHSGNGDSDHPIHGKTAPLLILLVGNELNGGEDQYKDFSITGAAQSAGISIEYFVDFYGKWRQTAHKNGKKR